MLLFKYKNMEELMQEIIIDTLIDSIKLLPFLFVAFLIIEYIEHKLNNKSKNIIKKSGKLGPLFGGIFGAFPQCGFSAAATNLYVTRIISLGTLISIYLSTSDEMLPILLSEKAEIKIILLIIILKIIIGMIFGFVIDYVLRNKKNNTEEEIKEFCNDEHCHCDHGIIKSSIKHTINILFFIMLVTFILNLGMFYLGEDRLSQIFMKNQIFGPFISSLVGLIPNCGASVVITELYLKGAITFGSAMAGLLTGSGVSLLVLFKINKNIKENLNILFMVYIIGVICGMIIDIIGFII